MISILGAAGGLMYVTASSVLVNNVDSSELGLASGILTSFRAGIPGVFVMLYIYMDKPGYYLQVQYVLV